MAQARHQRPLAREAGRDIRRWRGIREQLDRELAPHGLVLSSAEDSGVAASADLLEKFVRPDPLAHPGRGEASCVEKTPRAGFIGPIVGNGHVRITSSNRAISSSSR
jgi:hypothetical protein